MTKGRPVCVCVCAGVQAPGSLLYVYYLKTALVFSLLSHSQDAFSQQLLSALRAPGLAGCVKSCSCNMCAIMLYVIERFHLEDK